MKIIKDQNNVVLFAGELELTETGLIGPGWTAPGITTASHTIEDVESIPADWVGGRYSYDGEWTKTQAGVDYDTSVVRPLIQSQNKMDCKAFILSKYSEETQRNAALSIYGEVKKAEISDHIARIILEENRVFDLLEASNDPQLVEKPLWPEA